MAEAEKNILLAVIIGLIWIGIPLIAVKIAGTYIISSYKRINNFSLWIFSLFINTIMQELLVRGYIYQLIKNNYNKWAAIVVTTGIFTILHAGAFDAGLIAVLNVVSMSILMTVILEKTQSLAVPIIMHFIWNFVGGMVVDLISLTSDYPSMYHITSLNDSNLLGGKYGIESSLLVLVLNIVLSVVFYNNLLKTKEMP